MTMFNNLKISTKLALMLAIIASLVVVSSVFTYNSIVRTENVAFANRKANNFLDDIDTLLSSLVEEQNAMRAFMAKPDKQFIGRVAQYSNEVAKRLDALTSTI